MKEADGCMGGIPGFTFKNWVPAVGPQGWGTDKTANWLCRQMIAAKIEKSFQKWITSGEETFQSAERLRSNPVSWGGP
jgi:hypothetical protein